MLKQKCNKISRKREFSDIEKKRKLAGEIISILMKSIENPVCELNYTTDFQLLVSVILSAQATDVAVNRCMTQIYSEGFTPETVISWGEEKLRSKIKTIGLSRTKAKNIHRMSQILVDKYGGNIPRGREDLMSLPGVGRKTANVVLGELYGEKTLAVDTHVFRVTGRLGLQKEKDPIKAEAQLIKIIDEKYLPVAHHLLVLFGRYTCKAVKPRCGECELNKICNFFKSLLKKP
ncbi:MAG: endonuclease III [Oligoflexales bacterium]|nr:endonuclease III [Oligoflexales bacterium]